MSGSTPVVPGPEIHSRLEEKLESNSHKILYLVKRINQLSKSRGGQSVILTKDRLLRLAERLRDRGVVIDYTDARGYAKLKAIDQRGIDTLKKLNAVFHIDQIESFLDNVHL